MYTPKASRRRLDTCRGCDALFRVEKPRQQYCNNCGNLAHRQNNSKARRRQRDYQPDLVEIFSYLTEE